MSFGQRQDTELWNIQEFRTYEALSIRPKIPEIPGEERMERTFSGISFRNFRCTSRACPNIPENRNNRGRFPFDQKFRIFRVGERMEQTFSGVSFRNFGCTSRGWPKIPENRNNRKILFHSSHGIPEISFRNFLLNGKRPRFHGACVLWLKIWRPGVKSMWIGSTKAFNTHPRRLYLWTPCFKPRHLQTVID